MIVSLIRVAYHLCHMHDIFVCVQCLGSAQHLKSKYGDAWQIDANVAYGPLQTSFHQWITQKYQGSTVIENHGDNIKYRVPKFNADHSPLSIATLFRSMESHKDQFHLNDYSISETTLEQIFIGFARADDPEHHQQLHQLQQGPGPQGYAAVPQGYSASLSPPPAYNPQVAQNGAILVQPAAQAYAQPYAQPYGQPNQGQRPPQAS